MNNYERQAFKLVYDSGQILKFACDVGCIIRGKGRRICTYGIGNICLFTYL